MKATVLLIQIEGTDADLAPVLDLLRAQIAGETPPAAPALPEAPRDPAPDYSSSDSARSRKRRGRGPGRRGARRPTEPADESSEPPPPGKAQRLTPGPSTIGVGPSRERDGVSVADAATIRILERTLPNVGDSQRLVEFGDLGVRVAVREAAFEDPRFTVESKGRGVPVVIRRVG